MLRFVSALAAVAMAAVIATGSGGPPGSAQAGPGGPVVSVDAVSDAGNTATAVGPIDTSRSTTCGAIFNVDVVIRGVTNIAGFQADLLYNPAVLRVTAVNYNFLLTTTGTAVINFGNPTPDTDGDFLLFAAMYSITPFTGANGNGVLARITLEAVGSGSSALNLTSVKMADANAISIPPTDADGFYIGPVNDASIVVIPPCADTDGDGCPDVREQQTAVGSETSGGRRDYLNPYDYFDPTNDGIIRVNDILAVVGRYFSSGDPTAPINQIPPAPPAYHAKFDRAPLGPNVWNLTQGNGFIGIPDILAVIGQYFHDCHG